MGRDRTTEPLSPVGRDIGDLLACADWRSTALGDPAGWSQGLRTAAAMCLESRFPMLIMWGAELVMIYNEAFRPILGAKHPAMGQEGAECWAEAWPQVGPMLAGVRETGTPVYAEDLLVPLERHGQQEDCYFTFCYSPLRDEDRGVAGILVTVFETTERILSERRMHCLRQLAEVRAEATSTREVFDRAVGVLGTFSSEVPFACLHRLDPAGSVAESAFVGLREAIDPAAWPIPEVIADRTARRVTDLPAAVCDSLAGEYTASSALVIPVVGSGPATVEAVLVCGLNSRRVFDAGYASFLDLLREDLAAGVAAATAREQERRRVEALAELDRAKTAFLTNVSHEFRTPLTLMLGPLEDIIADVGDAPELVSRLDGVRRNGNRLLRLVNSLLDFTRIDADRSQPELEVADVGSLTAQIAASFAEVCERGGIALRLDCRPAVAAIDVGMWETIVLNIVSNAFKFTLEGSITVRTEPAGPDVVVTVTDTGRGIAPEDLPRLTERFYRASNVRGRSTEGSGIGLALVRDLVELHLGELAISSVPGRGTTVTVRLPAHAGLAPVAPADRPAMPGYTDNPFVAEARQWLSDRVSITQPALVEPSRPLILVVDDNADMRAYLERLLRGRWNVVSAADGERALAAARSLRPDLIVTDVMMPALAGVALTEAVRQDPGLGGVPIIILSARAGTGAATEGFAAGADDYLAKPFRSEDLINRVAARLAAVARAGAGAGTRALAAERSAALAELSARLSAVGAIPDLLAELLAAPVATLQATVAAVATLDPDRAHLRVQYAGDLRAEFVDRYHVIALDAPVPVAEVIRTGQAMVIDDTMALDPRFDQVVRDSAPMSRAVLIEPLRRADGQVIGALGLAWPRPRSFDAEATRLAGRVAHLAALTLDRLQVAEREHTIAAALQERLLELDVSSPGAVICGHYQPAGEMLKVGGDWYTTTALDDDGRVAVSVGDVVGNGIAGATVMSQLRSAVAAAALSRPEPEVVLDMLERYAARVSGAACATVAYAMIDTCAQTVEYACAGHPYPLLVEPDGRARYLQDGRRPPLASFAARPGAGARGRAVLPPGSLLVLYTDGLLERRGESLDAGMERLTAAAGRCARRPVGEVCGELIRQLRPPEGFADDLAILAIRPPGITACSFVASVRAQARELAPLRRRLRAWLRSPDVGLSADLVNDVVLAVSEALNNAMEHGSGFDPTRTVTLELFAGRTKLSATVSDAGAWKGDSAASRRESRRGRGLTVIHGLSQDVATDRTSLGTRITMRFPTAGPRPVRA